MESKGNLRLVRDVECDLPEGWVVKKKTPSWCAHLSVMVDAVLRRAECGICGETLDPIQCLIDMAQREEKVVSRLQELQTLENYHAERRKSERKTGLLKERKHLIKTFGEKPAIEEFKNVGGSSLCFYGVPEERWADQFRHEKTGFQFYLTRRGRFYVLEGKEAKRIDPLELRLQIEKLVTPQ